MKSVIARSESVVAIEQDFGGDIVFITFNAAAIPHVLTAIAAFLAEIA